MTHVSIAGPALAAEIASRGAELQRLRDGRGRDLLWHGDAAWWTGRSPILFPIVGRLPDDRIAIDGNVYSMPQHGLARVSDFICSASSAASCTFELASSPATKAAYPFDFVLRLHYEIAGNALQTKATVENRSRAPMPFSLGFHPALVWPLPSSAGRGGHTITFEKAETAPIFRTHDGLTRAASEPSPVQDRTLHLDDRLFDDGVMIFDRLASRSLVLAGRGGPSIRVSYDTLPHLGIWSKPGAPFVCIEPWQGFATPAGYQGELRDKPGVVNLAPGARREFRMDIELVLES